MDKKPVYMKIKPISQYSGLPEKLVRKLVNNGEVEYFRSGRTIYVSVKSIEELCKN